MGREASKQRTGWSLLPSQYSTLDYLEPTKENGLAMGDAEHVERLFVRRVEFCASEGGVYKVESR